MELYLMYLRKSRQDDQNESVDEVLAKHEKMLQDHAVRNFGYQIPNKNVYREIVSGETLDERKEIGKIFNRMESEDVTGVLCVDCSRLSRGSLLDCGIVVRNFLYTNTLVVTPTKTYDLTDKYDRKFFEMELTRGNDYLEYSREVLQRGIYNSVSSGSYVASVPPYGFNRIKIDKCWTLEINEEEAEYVRMAFDMYANQGIGANTIAHKLNDLGAKTRHGQPFKETTIRQMLQNEVYLGKIRYQAKKVERVLVNGELKKKTVRCKDYKLFEGKHSRIISDELFEKAKHQRSRVTREKPDLTLQNAFAGLIKCKKCGKAIAMRVYRKDKVEYRKPRYYCRGGVYCDNKSSNVDDVQLAIIDALKQSLEDFKVKVDTNSSQDDKPRKNLIKSLEKQQAALKKRMEDICEYLEKGIYSVDMFIERKAKIEEETIRVENALKNAHESAPKLEDYKEKIVSLHQALDMLQDDTISAKTKNNFLKKVIKVIYYEKIDKEFMLEVELL